jgi:PHD/YefM family antitoxin component YafN of YafNO toxin-antitoxin module
VRSLKEHDRVIITNNGVGESVLINIEDYAEYEDFLHRRFVYDELQKSKAILDDPNVKLAPHSEVMDRLRKKREARNHV